ncbi:hypothetical protein HDU96_009246 [Phlyctochytrium bullatum]|nr:hypothetical protein HDU96_009246 [Phlyctochytrium bullatum]
MTTPSVEKASAAAAESAPYDARPTSEGAPVEETKKPLTAGRIAYLVFTSLTFWMVAAMLIGILIGSTAPEFAVRAKPTANIFLRPIQFVVFPLVFSSLVAAIAGHGDLKSLGRLGLKAFIYFEIVTTLALIIGLVMVNLIRPGDSVPSKTYKPLDGSGFSYEAWIGHLTPRTWGEMMTGELLQTFVASVVFGCSAAMAPPKYRDLIVDLANAVMKTMFNFVNIVIWTAPLGVCFAIAGAIGANSGGLSILASLGKLVMALYVSLILFAVLIFGTVFLIARINPIEFVMAIREPLLIAFTTATSEAALPRAIECLEAYGVSPRVTVFTLTFGYSFNLDGSTLYLALASVFCAQATGVSKSVAEQVVMVLLLMVTSKGVAGVRQASLIVLASSLATFNISPEPIAVILGVDWFMDMGRTFINVFGNCLATVYMAKLEKEFRVGQQERLTAPKDEESGVESSNGTDVAPEDTPRVVRKQVGEAKEEVAVEIFEETTPAFGKDVKQA